MLRAAKAGAAPPLRLCQGDLKLKQAIMLSRLFGRQRFQWNPAVDLSNRHIAGLLVIFFGR